MTTFERCFVSDKNTWAEKKNPYYSHIERYESVCDILHEFGLSEYESHIINGHVPVRVGKGESPIKANGRYILIDGGFCKSYHNTTGIAGYTLIYSSRGLRLVSHSPFEGKMAAIEDIYQDRPHLDCGSCGAPNCHALAEDIIKNDAKLGDCLIQLRDKQNKN